LNNAWADAVAFLIMRDNDLNLVSTPQFPISPDAMDIPVRTPAYWLSRRKTRYYYDAFIAKSHRDIMQFTFDYSISRQTIYDWEKDFRDIYAWINSLQPPPYPHKIDRALAAKGMVIFTNNCARCHGAAGDKYPEKVIPLDVIGTDPVRLQDLPVPFKRHLDKGWTGQYGTTPLYPDSGGYLAPPLDGVWATAPYLHNGSVPTLWHLLTPDSRPSVWLRTDNGYDQKRVGLEFKAFDRMPAEVTTQEEKRLYYQSDLRGLSNEGHRFPAKALSEPDKRALIEYLKTL